MLEHILPVTGGVSREANKIFSLNKILRGN